MRYLTATCMFIALGCCAAASGESAQEAVRGLVSRLLPDHAEAFLFEPLPPENDRDVFEIEAQGGTVVVRGSTGVAMASGLNWYLEQCCGTSVSLRGNQLNLPDPLPMPETKIRIVTPFRYRYCFNYCVFSYSMAWWDWEQWEQVIDWMALQGINMPLAVTGQEAVWRSVYREMGLDDDDLAAFFVGPAYLPFGWMGCMDGWGGPLTDDWVDRHAALQCKIAARERAFGMTPVLQGFTGHVPAALARVRPEAKYQQLPSWCGFPGTLFVDPQDPLFKEIGWRFIEEQTRSFGTDHYYAADTFIEMSPPSDDPAFIKTMAEAVYGGMAAADPKAKWLMQGWLFVNNPDFWKEAQTEALLTALPNEKMLVLDLWCENEPAWNQTRAFYGKPWLWCIIQSFGNQVSLHGGLPQIVRNLKQALESQDRGDLQGMGLIMEGLDYNPVVFDLMGDLFWQPECPGLDAWIAAYVLRRYGRDHADVLEAWQLLLDTAYRVPGHAGSDICRRPVLEDAGQVPGSRRGYDVVRLARACDYLLRAAGELQECDTYRYDLVHVLRQVLSDLAVPFSAEVSAAYHAGDRERLTAAGNRLLELLSDTDSLLATRGEFLLGSWLAEARSWGRTAEEKAHYEWNARNQITLWGPEDSRLHDYAAKQWSGLVGGFYLPRWKMFVQRLDEALAAGIPFDAAAWEKEIRAWEAGWTRQQESYPEMPSGNAVTVARHLWEKYHEAALKEGG